MLESICISSTHPRRIPTSTIITQVVRSGARIPPEPAGNGIFSGFFLPVPVYFRPEKPLEHGSSIPAGIIRTRNLDIPATSENRKIGGNTSDHPGTYRNYGKFRPDPTGKNNTPIKKHRKTIGINRTPTRFFKIFYSWKIRSSLEKNHIKYKIPIYLIPRYWKKHFTKKRPLKTFKGLFFKSPSF